MKILSAAIANFIILLVIFTGAYLNSNYPELYYRALQEDEIFEWISYWGFFTASVVFTINTIQQYRLGIKLPWFSAGLAIFCFIVAMEEISWGQRLLGYRPPAYFLENNFQQEFNIHNVFAKDLRILSLKAIILGYGIVLPLFAFVPLIKKAYYRLGITTAPVELVPAFLATFMLYHIYPWKYSGELAEMMLGFGFLFSSLFYLRLNEKSIPSGTRAGWIKILTATAIVLTLGIINTGLSRQQRDSDPAIMQEAKREAEALHRDFLTLASGRGGSFPSRCGYHVRIHKYSTKYDKAGILQNGQFKGLVNQGLPKERAEFFLDPWNSPYWVRDNCLRDGSRIISVYSFGPDRKRQTLPKEILGDDIGKLIIIKSSK